MNRKLYREIQVKSKVKVTSENRIHFLVNMNSRGFQRRKLIEKKDKSLDYYTTLFQRMRLHEQCQTPYQSRRQHGCITTLKDGKYIADFTFCMPF